MSAVFTYERFALEFVANIGLRRIRFGIADAPGDQRIKEKQ
jgi:hypothetical protein